MLGGSSNKSKNTSYVRMGNLQTREGSAPSKDHILYEDNSLVDDDKLGRSEVMIAGGREIDVGPLHIPPGKIAYSREVDVV